MSIARRLPELDATCNSPAFQAVAEYCRGGGGPPERVATKQDCGTQFAPPWQLYEEDPDIRPYIWELDPCP